MSEDTLEECREMIQIGAEKFYVITLYNIVDMDVISI